MSNKPVHAQAYYGSPVNGQRQSSLGDASVQAGGVPFEGDVPPVVVKPQGRKATKSKGV
jgi:hypothetical protein